MIGSKIIAGSHSFVAVVNVLLPICCHIESVMPYLHILVEDIVVLFGSMTDKWVWELICGLN